MLFDNSNKIIKIDFHLDLIAGLPLENLQRFSKSFDDVFRLYPKELQLGFLKLLRGTSLRKKLINMVIFMKNMRLMN